MTTYPLVGNHDHGGKAMITFDDTPTLVRTPARDNGRTTVKAREPSGPKLADPTPPLPPADIKAIAYGRTHYCVIWFVGGIRKDAYGTKELAFEALERACTSYGALGAYKAAVTNGRDILKCNTITA